MFTSNVLTIHMDARQQTAEMIMIREWILSGFTAVSEKRFCMNPTACVIMNISSFCPVSGAPLWPYESLLLFTLNRTCEHSHAQNPTHCLETSTSELVFSSQRRQRIRIRLTALVLSAFLGEFSFLSGQPVKCVIGGKLDASA